MMSAKNIPYTCNMRVDNVTPEICRTLAEAMPEMLLRQRGVVPQDVTLYAAETRTSSPVRVVRGPTGESPAAAGLFPAGEGAGYAGGIISSGVDGLRAAEGILGAVAGSRWAVGRWLVAGSRWVAG